VLVGLLRWLLPSSPALVTNEEWVRRQLAKNGGSFTYRPGLAGMCWNPSYSGVSLLSQAGINPIVGPAEVTYTAHEDGRVTATVMRPGEEHIEHLGQERTGG
jgi:hypothetical protein